MAASKGERFDGGRVVLPTIKKLAKAVAKNYTFVH